MHKPIYRMHPILKMGFCVIVTALSFPSWNPARISLVCLLLVLLQLADYRPSIWRNIAATALISGLMFFIAYGFSEDISGSLSSALHFSVLLLASYYMFQTSPSELLHGLQSCHIPDQMLLGFLVMYRFVDVLRGELSDIYQASTMVSRKNIGFFRKVYRCLIIPFSYRLFVLSDQLSLSVMSRDFGCTQRTQYRENKIQSSNAGFAVAATALSVVILCLPLK